MTFEPKLRWGILGCARISRRGLIPGIRSSQRTVLHALASRELSTAQAWAAEFAVPRAHGSYESILADPEIDAVYLPLPNELHRQWVFAAADAGKHILCEKPLALNSSDARAMVEYCQTRGILLMEAFMWRHQPRTASLLRLVSEGAVGDLRLIRSSFSFPIEPNDWRLDSARGGGALWDVGCYGVSTARLFAGTEPDSYGAEAHFNSSDVDLSLSACLRFPNGILGQIDCSFEQPFRCEYELVGTTGVITVPDAYLPPARPTAMLRSGESVKDLVFDGHNQYGEMVDAFARSIEKKELAHPSEDGLHQMIALDAVLKAARGE